MKFVFAIICSLLFGGCATTMQQSYPQVDQHHLWTAMIAAAKSPTYTSSDPRNRWVVGENAVEVYLRKAQIDVKRTIHRTLQLPRQRPQRDRRDVWFSVYLLPTHPLKIEFISHTDTLFPNRNVKESNRYFSDVESILLPILEP